MPPTSDENTLNIALILQKLDSLTKAQDANHAEIKAILSDHEDRIRALERSNTELSARLALSQILQATFTTIGSAVAAVLGRLS